jgi:hypothetical protein
MDAHGLLRRNGRAYVPNDAAVKGELLKVNHNDPLAGHFGARKTQELIRRKYFWDRLAKDVKDYVKACGVCQRTTVQRHQPYGELASLPQPDRPWQEVTMDFITGLPPSAIASKAYDSILVVVDRFTKLARYIPVKKTLDASELADVFIRRIVKDFGTPAGIVSDRGSVFTSKFWSALCFYLKVRRRLSTAFHPQTDGQTERQNQVLEHYLRCYCNYRQDDWCSKLAMAEYAYNNSVHSTIGCSPFFAMYGYHPQLRIDVEDDVPGGEAPAAKERAMAIEQEREVLSTQWRNAVEAQKKHHDKKHKPMRFSIGDQVMLSAKNIRQLRPSKKLSDRYLGPFSVTKVVGTQAYELKLPAGYKIHPVFHVSLLEPYHQGDNAEPTPPAIEIDGDPEWEVEAVIGHRQRRGKTEYLVRWKGYAPAEDTWQSAQDLVNAPEALRTYRDNAYPRKRRRVNRRT